MKDLDVRGIRRGLINSSLGIEIKIISIK
jgi:hypothetical protein